MLPQQFKREHMAQVLEGWRAAAAQVARPVAFMEVCGTHTVAAWRSGLHSLMPVTVTLLSGPGCPVCVTSQGDIDGMVELAGRSGVTFCSYGDMLRVPGKKGSLEQARSAGADVRVVYSALDAVGLAARQPRRQVVFAAVGFETTAPASAVAIQEAQRQGLTNFSVLVSHKRIVPAMLAISSGASPGGSSGGPSGGGGLAQVGIDGFLCPGHVAVIVGAKAFAPVVEECGLPCVVAGFEPLQMAQGLARLTELVRDKSPVVENLYPQAVTEEGNARALELMDEVFCPAPARWRALGAIADSGLGLRREYQDFDAAARFGLHPEEAPEPVGCRCGDVIMGRCRPVDCAMFGGACTPVHPIGPCMVSSEGSCQAWFKYGEGLH